MSGRRLKYPNPDKMPGRRYKVDARHGNGRPYTTPPNEQKLPRISVTEPVEVAKGLFYIPPKNSKQVPILIHNGGFFVSYHPGDPPQDWYGYGDHLCVGGPGDEQTLQFLRRYRSIIKKHILPADLSMGRIGRRSLVSWDDAHGRPLVIRG